jgi:ABC-type dipeptide/oligopeptide/nickel transport system permease subunit
MGGFVTAPLEVLGPPGPAPGAVEGDVRGRSPAQIAWLRFRRNKVAFAAGVVVLLLLLGALAAPLLVHWFGHPPEEFHSDQIDPSLSRPIKPFGGISREFLLGVEPINGRDLFSRILYGAQISLLIALLATLLSVVLGVLLGIVAGYFGGWADALISRTMDLFLAFPLLLFAIALAGVVQNEAFGLRGNTLHVAVLVFIIGFFAWPYIGRIIRGQTLSLREREFVDAARSVGAGPGHILFRELLPNLWAPIIVYSTLLIPTNILFEAALSFLGVGVHPPTPSWGGMLASAVPLYTVDPYFMIIPGAAIFVTVLAFNILGDGLREALDPRTR